MLSVVELRKTYPARYRAPDVAAVRGVTFSIAEGEFHTLLGPSGCGKTTTLQCVAGLENPDSGLIQVGDASVFSDQNRINVPPHRRDIGMVFQSYAIWPHMSVFDNVAFPLAHGRKRTPRRQIRERVLSGRRRTTTSTATAAQARRQPLRVPGPAGACSIPYVDTAVNLMPRSSTDLNLRGGCMSTGKLQGLSTSCHKAR